MNFKDEDGDEDYDALSQKHLASIKRDTRVSFEDAAVRAIAAIAAPPKREWVGMEWEDIQLARQRCGSMVEAMQYINDWLKEKNT